MKVQTMNEVVGANLRKFREAEGLTLAQCAMTITYLTDSFSESKLSRWENGKYHFTLEDLHFMSLIYGVGILGLLTPAKDVTHITAMGVKYSSSTPAVHSPNEHMNLPSDPTNTSQSKLRSMMSKTGSETKAGLETSTPT
jgi:transcriptional regulator with XRE-family HTH domain